MYENEIMRILSCDLLSQLAQQPQVSLIRLNALYSMLYQAGIAFDTKFSPGTRRQAGGIELTIYITPTVTMVYSIDLGSGPTEFTNG